MNNILPNIRVKSAKKIIIKSQSKEKDNSFSFSNKKDKVTKLYEDKKSKGLKKNIIDSINESDLITSKHLKKYFDEFINGNNTSGVSCFKNISEDYNRRLNKLSNVTTSKKIVKSNSNSRNNINNSFTPSKSSLVNKLQAAIRSASKSPIKQQETAKFNKKSFSKKKNIYSSEQHSEDNNNSSNDSLKGIEYLATEPNKELKVSNALNMSINAFKKQNLEINNINNISIIHTKKNKQDITITYNKLNKLISFLDKTEENNISIFTTHYDNIIIEAINKKNGKSVEKKFHYTDIYPDGEYDRLKEYIEQNSVNIRGI